MLDKEDGGAAKSDGKEGVRGGIGRLKLTAEQNWAVVDDKKFIKDEIDGGDSEVKKSEDFKRAVNFFETFSLDELDETKNDKEGDWERQAKTGVFGDFIPEFIIALVAV